jgi:hypothetical protein
MPPAWKRTRMVRVGASACARRNKTYKLFTTFAKSFSCALLRNESRRLACTPHTLPRLLFSYLQSHSFFRTPWLGVAMPLFPDATQPLLLSEVIGQDSSLQTVALKGWTRRDIILFSIESAGWIGFSVAWAYLFVLPLCGKLFHCECVWLWDKSAGCLAVSRAQSCPFCGSGKLDAASFIPQWGVVPIMVAAALLMRY